LIEVAGYALRVTISRMTTGARPGTLDDYTRRILRVLEHLAANLDADLDLARLADLACFSPFHFHRIYHAVQGETVAETVRRMRLHRAAVDLLEHEKPIPRIAVRAGYGSQAAFTRAFRHAYGMPPAAYRAAVGEPPGPYAVQVRSVEPVRVAAVRHHGDYAAIGGAFDRLFAFGASRGLLRPTSRCFGLFHQDPAGTPVESLRSDACLEVPPSFASEGDVRTFAIPGGRQAAVLHVGPYAELNRAYTWLYGSWLIQSGEEPADHPCVEEYLNDPRVTPAPELRTEVALPLV
jgi:AraC family transcriptional regulator